MPCMVDLMVQWVSLVSSPANDKPVLIKSVIKSVDGKRGLLEFNVKFVSKNIAKKQVCAVVYEPGTVDLQDDWIEPEELVKTAHGFLHWGYQKNVDMQHEFIAGFGGIVESFILNGIDDRFPETKKGAWCVVIQLTDEGMERIEEIKGVSLAGMCRYDMTKEPPTPMKMNKQKVEGTTDVAALDGVIKNSGTVLRRLRREYDLGEKTVATAMGLSVEDYGEIEDGNADFEWTEESVNKVAKLFKMSGVAFLIALQGSDAPAAEDPAATDEADPALDPSLDPNKSTDAEGSGGTAADGKDKSTDTAAGDTGNPAKTAKADTEDSAKGASKTVGDSPDTGSDNNTNSTIKMEQEIRKEKKLLKSGTVQVNDGGNEEGNVRKHYTAEQTKMKHIEQAGSALFKYKTNTPKEILQKGIIDLDFIDPGGNVTPAQANSIISLIQVQNPFLNEIQVVKMKSKKQNVLVWDVGTRKLRRFKGGFTRSVDTDTIDYLNKSLVLDANKVNLEWLIDNDTLVNFQGDIPGLENEIVRGFTQAAANDLLDLGLNGTADSVDAEELTWAELGIGWRKLAQANPTAAQTILTGGATGLDDPQEIMDAMIDALMANGNERFDTGEHKIILGKRDYRTHSKTLGQRTDGIKVLVEGAEKEFQGYNLADIPFMEAKNMLFTPPKNLVMGVLAGEGLDAFRIQRFVVPDGLLFRATAYVDFAIVNPAAMVDAHTVVL